MELSFPLVFSEAGPTSFLKAAARAFLAEEGNFAWHLRLPQVMMLRVVGVPSGFGCGQTRACFSQRCRLQYEQETSAHLPQIMQTALPLFFCPIVHSGVDSRAPM
jgi:hypothetical protein